MLRLRIPKKMMRRHPPLIKKIHFVGIGGIGMSGIAEVLANLGYEVTGSDLVENANIQRLRRLNIPVFIGHKAENIEGAQVIVVSTDIKVGNIEVDAARLSRIPVIRRAEMLAELMRLKLSIAISGTHGKTTTTSLTASLLDAAALDPTVVNGGIINAYGTNARLGEGEWIVVEADESDGSFLKLPGTIAVVTNIDPEHLNYYSTFEALKQAFINFIDRIPFYGLGILCIDHPEVRAILSKVLDRRIVTYGFSQDANVRGVNLRPSANGTLFDVDFVPNLAVGYDQIDCDNTAVVSRSIKNLFLPMVGQHNVQNALAVVAIAQELEINDEIVVQAFSSFKGVKRRFTFVDIVNNITIIDDYAHHPVEIKTVLAAAHQATTGRVIAVVQPHRYSRLQDLFSDFTTCFSQADVLILAPIFAAGEDPIEGISSEALADIVCQTGKEFVYTLRDSAELAPLVAEVAQSGDMVVCMGAGSITYWAADLPGQLSAIKNAARA